MKPRPLWTIFPEGWGGELKIYGFPTCLKLWQNGELPG